ncbi:sulfatase-like hydrolase/transferase [Phenylobacterium sp.]|uniref:sulfatase-like hydrolase/transferase n=1 Tax=Phenylobacterium sp. TaxID=1871053 RepID=UPI0025EDDD4A|nr:sulfatase-like hydrolase/transferase [Phenylobacterium sp.]MBX3482346.1 sulfatase-like hydrolase/transferase [Phenylobacterium sp.]MCW5759174.1 sulfatase-like hydrolase/transferase [Phenylobacterium sp.]
MRSCSRPTSRASMAAAATLGALSVMSAPAQAAAPSARPNVVVIVADDLGYNDLSSYGSKYPTPNIDRLAKDGVRFTQGYVTAALCSPSRAGMLTGRYQQRFGHEYQLYTPLNNRRDGIDPGQPTLARSLHDAGYRTALYGKWHLGMAPERHPLKMGFDEFFGVSGGQTPYIAADRPDVVSSPPADQAPGQYQRNESSSFQEAGQPVDLQDYATTAFTDHALSFIDKNKDRPFFLMMTYTAPHVPLQATKAQLAKLAAIEDPEMRLYRTVINELDIGVGQIRERLAKNGLTDNTIVVFISDNGCPDYVKQVCSNDPLNAWKRYLTEGGVRVPYMMSWPAKVKGGRTYDGVVSSLDIFPTVAAAAGAKGDDRQPTDGRDLLPYLQGKAKGAPHDRLYWRSLPSYAIRDGDWKLIVNASPKGETVTMLFDLAKDRAEKHDLAPQNPEIVARLNREWKAWSDTLAAPRWPTAREFDVEINGVPVRTTN